MHTLSKKKRLSVSQRNIYNIKIGHPLLSLLVGADDWNAIESAMKKIIPHSQGITRYCNVFSSKV